MKKPAERRVERQTPTAFSRSRSHQPQRRLSGDPIPIANKLTRLVLQGQYEASGRIRDWLGPSSGRRRSQRPSVRRRQWRCPG